MGDMHKPGLAVVWRKSLEVVVTNIILRRLQVVCCSSMGTFINVYAPTGSQGERERNNLFSHELLPLINSNRFPKLVGDWNCLTRKEDVEGGLDETEETSRRISEPLRVLLRDFGYQDAFLVKDSKRKGYTWHRRNIGLQCPSAHLTTKYTL